MGIGLSVLELYGNLLRDGYFKNSKSIIELGSQDVVEWEQEKIGTKLEEMADYKYQKGTALTSEILHKSLGLENYECIDPDGRNNSLFRVPFDGRYLEGSKLQDNYAYQLNSNEHIKFVSQFHSEEYVKLAKIYEGSGQLEQAGEAYGTAAYFATRLAHILQTEGQTEEAAYYYGKAEELNACKPNQ